jgi:hypothetical protein
MIKETVHKKLYGENCEQNELTKTLIEIAATGKKEQIPELMSRCLEIMKTEKDTKADENLSNVTHGEVKDLNSLESV